MATRTNYTSDAIDRQEQARKNYEADTGNADRKKELEIESERVKRALKQKGAGAGRGSERPPMSRKWTE